jgi:hypothetical protein|tara:strand:+ start:818 stop:1942 length:1125 start_codon:yes stop_codon:yes gene_type:complete
LTSHTGNPQHASEVAQRYWDDNLRHHDVETILRCEEWLESEDAWANISRERERPNGAAPSRWRSEFRKVESNVFDENPYKYFVGLELEVNDSKVINHIRETELSPDGTITQSPQSSQTNWDCVHDGSLNCGSEFRLREVYQGDQALDEVRKFCVFLHKRGYKIDDTCSVHIHIDARDMNLTSLKNLIKMHRRYEDFLYEFVRPSRKDTRFCRPTKRTGPAASTVPYSFEPLNAAMRAENLRDFKHAYYQCGDHTNVSSQYEEQETYKYYDGRYWGFNVHSMFLNGTVEVRHLHGTIDPDVINSWMMINLAMVHKANQGLTRRERRTLEYSNEPTLREFMNLFPDNIQVLFEKGHDKERMFRKYGKKQREDYVSI